MRVSWGRRAGGISVGPALLLMAVPVALYYWLVVSHGVNVPYGDTWNGNLPLLVDYAQGHLGLTDLWAPHNQNRMLVPFAILVLLDSATRMNQVVDMLVSATMLVAGVALLCWLAARTLRVSAAWIVPLPFILLSFVQTENALHAIQLSWTVIILLTALALALLELGGGRWVLFGLACLASALASYSSLQGLLVWPVGLLYGFLAGWRRTQGAVWVLLAAVAVFLYARDFGPVEPPVHAGGVFSHPVVTVEYFVLLVGAPFAFHRPEMGVLMLAALVVAAAAALRRDTWSRSRLPAALVVLALLFSLLPTAGRVGMGTSEAAAPRYSTFNLILLAGAYLFAVVAARPAGWRSRVSHWWRLLTSLRGELSRAIPLALCGGLVLLQLGLGLNYGLSQALQMSASLSQGASLLRHYADAPDAQLGADLFHPSGAYVKQWAPTLQAHRWSVFS